MTLQPAAGAHGELTGILLVRALLASRGRCRGRRVLIPDSAHGTNPATAAMAGYAGRSTHPLERAAVLIDVSAAWRNLGGLTM
jgi:glycine dehydrogenase subunit 2